MTTISIFVLSLCFTIVTWILTKRIHQNTTDITELKLLIDKQDAVWKKGFEFKEPKNENN